MTIPWKDLAHAVQRARLAHDPEALAQLDAYVEANPPLETSTAPRRPWGPWIEAFKARHGQAALPRPVAASPAPPPSHHETDREPGEDDVP